jgi:pimeloyl-ACP methyl ester carboxylesterase
MPTAAATVFLKSKQRLVASSGARFHVAEAGRGHTVVLIGGWPQTMLAWRHIFPKLAERCRTIVVEPPALGAGDPLPGGHDSKTVAAAIVGLLRDLGVMRCDVVGHDIGAWLGFPMAHLAPDMIERLCVIDAAVPGLAGPAAYMLAPERVMKVWHFYFNALPDLPAALTEGRERIYIEYILRTRSHDFARTFTREDVEEYVAAYSRPGAMDQGFSYYRAIFKNMTDNVELAKTKLTLPILAIGGAHWLGPVMQASFAPVGTNVTGVSVEGSAHFVPEEAPGEVLRLLWEFLGRGV